MASGIKGIIGLDQFGKHKSESDVLSRRSFLTGSLKVACLAALAGCSTINQYDRFNPQDYLPQLGFNVFRITEGRITEGEETGYKTRYIAVTPEKDDDNLSAVEGRATLATEYVAPGAKQSRKNFYDIGLSQGLIEKGFSSRVTINGEPIEDFLKNDMKIKPDENGVYSNFLDKDAPHYYSWDPENHHFRGNLPAGYHIQFIATDGKHVTSIETGTPISDLFQLYAKEINSRNSLDRNTGNSLENILLGWSAAGEDIGDFLKSLTIGYKVKNIHTGEEDHREGTLESLVNFLPNIVTGKIGDALGNLSRISSSVVDAYGFLLSSVNNSIVNSVAHITLGSVHPEAASYLTDVSGTLLQIHAKNLPFGERFNDVIDPSTYFNLHCAHCPVTYTRTPVQMPLDFSVSGAQSYVLYKIFIEEDGREGDKITPEEVQLEGPSPPGGPPFEVPRGPPPGVPRGPPFGLPPGPPGPPPGIPPFL